MCCIFTCCGWMIDLIQRLWTFTMSCCISLAVCCSLITASMAGIALGYNYSLAEYIDLKETNVSVYLKRGIFDDEISDDMKFRRSGHLPISGHIKEDNLITGSVDESSTLRSGRRLEDSIYQSNDKNNFEDSLMRLTAKAPDFSSTEETPKAMSIGDIVEKYPSNSLEQLKAFQSAINMRRMEATASRSTTIGSTKTPYQDVRIIPNFPIQSYPNAEKPFRRMQFETPSYQSSYNSLRKAVPADNVNDPIKWMPPNLPPQAYSRPMPVGYDLSDYSPTYPTPITPRPGPVRPTRPKQIKPKVKYVPEPKKSTQVPKLEIPKSIDEEMDTFKEKFMVEKDFTRDKENDFVQTWRPLKSPDEDYDYEVKGVPVRKKRSMHIAQT